MSEGGKGGRERKERGREKLLVKVIMNYFRISEKIFSIVHPTFKMKISKGQKRTL